MVVGCECKELEITTDGYEEDFCGYYVYYQCDKCGYYWEGYMSHFPIGCKIKD